LHPPCSESGQVLGFTVKESWEQRGLVLTPVSGQKKPKIQNKTNKQTKPQRTHLSVTQQQRKKLGHNVQERVSGKMELQKKTDMNSNQNTFITTPSNNSTMENSTSLYTTKKRKFGN
jgi:hypothetical protein